MSTIHDRARGRWVEILTTEFGVDARILDGKHHPCPACGGTDRFRFNTRKIDDGVYFCQGQAGSGMDLVMHITGIDFAPAMLELASKEADCCQAADIEKLPFAAANFDLWWSSLSIQWCNAATVFSEAFRVLRPGGQVAFSTLCPDTFAELRAAFAGVDQHRHTLPFNEPDAIHTALLGAGLRNIRLVRERHTVYYPELKSLLRSIKAIGAQNVGEGGRNGMMGRRTWQKVEATYEQFRTPAGLPASYDVLLGYATK